MRTLVVVPVFNRPDLIIRALDSVAAQSRPPDAVAVVDDGSTDTTAPVVASWIEAHPDLHAQMIRSANMGASAARNLGLARMGQGMDLVAFLDSDDLWPADFLARGCLALQSRPDAAAASTDREFRWQHEARRRHDSLASITANPWQWMIVRDAGIGSCTLFRLTAVHAAGGYPEDIPTGHDSVLFGRIAAHGPWLHLPGAPTIFLRSSSHGHHLYQKYPDHLVWWAKSTHRVWLEAPAGVHFDFEGRKSLARRWHAAARSALRRGECQQARFCIKNAIRLRPWATKHWSLWLRTFAFGRSR